MIRIGKLNMICQHVDFVCGTEDCMHTKYRVKFQNNSKCYGCNVAALVAVTSRRYVVLESMLQAKTAKQILCIPPCQPKNGDDWSHLKAFSANSITP